MSIIDCHIMPPPRGVLTKCNPTSNNLKRVLDEDTYVEALESIIERDFFPNIVKMKRESDQISNNYCTIDKLCDNISLDAFLQNNTSEDNASFEEIHRKDILENRKQFPWVYPIEDISDNEAARKRFENSMLFRLDTTGELLTIEQRERFDKLLECSPKIGDDRPSGPDLWRFRAKNSLMFTPDLADSRDVCRLGDDKQQMLMIANHKTDDLRQKLSDIKSRGGHKSIIHGNTDFPSPVSSEVLLPSHESLLWTEHPHAPTDYSGTSLGGADSNSDWDTVSVSGDDSTRAANYRLVEMTPLMVPGASGDSPIFTWGEVCGTPCLLSGPGDGIGTAAADKGRRSTFGGFGCSDWSGVSGDGGSTENDARGRDIFKLQPAPARELLARQLDNKGKVRSRTEDKLYKDHHGAISGHESSSVYDVLPSPCTSVRSNNTVATVSSSLSRKSKALETYCSSAQQRLEGLSTAGQALARQLTNTKTQTQAHTAQKHSRNSKNSKAAQAIDSNPCVDETPFGGGLHNLSSNRKSY